VKEPGLQPDFIEVHHARDGIGLVGLNGKIKTESATTAETDQGSSFGAKALYLVNISTPIYIFKRPRR